MVRPAQSVYSQWSSDGVISILMFVRWGLVVGQQFASRGCLRAVQGDRLLVETQMSPLSWEMEDRWAPRPFVKGRFARCP